MTAPTRPRPRQRSARPVPAKKSAPQHRRARTQTKPALQRKGTNAAPKPTWRLLTVLAVMVLAAGGLTYRLADLQIKNAEEFVEIGRQQRFRTVELAGGRGEILDRNGNTMATSLPSTSFFVDPKFVEDPIGDANRLAPVLGLPVEDVRELLASDGRFAWLTRQTTDAKAAEIQALDIAGVFTTEEPNRFQPSGASLARAVVGNVNIDGGGLSGVELIFDELLAGQTGELSIEIGAGVLGAPELSLIHI